MEESKNLKKYFGGLSPSKEWIRKCVDKRDKPLPASKECSMCKLTKDAIEFRLRNVKSKFDGGKIVYLRSRCKACEVLYITRKYHRDPKLAAERYRTSILSWRYGISRVILDQMNADQGGVCAICKASSPGHTKSWHIDHDHTTGRVRGLLCNKCNLALAFFGDSEKVLLSAAAYLRSGTNYGTAKNVEVRTRKR